MKISTENIGRLPSPENLKRLSQSLAVLDAILQPIWSLRYFSFNASWQPNETMASMRDGSGEAYFIVFKREGAILLAQTLHSPAGSEVRQFGNTLPKNFSNVPELFNDVLEESAFSTQETTFCLWRLVRDASWTVGGEARDVRNNSRDLLFALDGQPETYKEWAEDYFETNVLLEAVQRIYNREQLTEELIQSLNPAITLRELLPDVKEIGYNP